MIELDRRLERWIVEHRIEWLDPLVVGITYAGSFGAVWIVLGVVAALALRRPVIAIAVPITVLLADLSAAGLKNAVDRDRPELGLEGSEPLVTIPSSPAFPSGHAATSFAAAAVLAVVLPAFAPLLFGLATLMAWSRLYVGVHYPLDVVAGAVLGAVVATALLLLARALRRLRSRPTPNRPRGRWRGPLFRRTRPESTRS